MQCLKDAAAYCARLGVGVKRLLTDNGSTFRSKDFANACEALGITHKFTRAYGPQTNGKAEQFIQSALREWLVAGGVRTAHTAPMPCPAGSVMTTGTVCKAALAAKRPCPAGLIQETSS